MNPDQNNQYPQTDLPKPQVPEQPATGGQETSASPPSAERQSMQAELPQQSPGMPPLTPPPASSSLAPAVIDNSKPDPAITAQPSSESMGLKADDTDLIEKEWVVRAKAIVEKTKNDPHLQNREMSRIKADYVKKRYNKELKVSEG